MTWAKGHYDSICGTIIVGWRIDGGELTLAVTIPPNTSATVHVPTSSSAQVLESSKPAAEAEGVTPTGAGDRVATYNVESGDYVFTTPWN